MGLSSLLTFVVQLGNPITMIVMNLCCTLVPELATNHDGQSPVRNCHHRRTVDGT